MDEQLNAERKDQSRAASNGTEPSLDPLRRYYIAREHKTPGGTPVMQTLDGEVYMRHTDGSIRSVHKKINCKVSRKLRGELRRNAKRD